MMTDKSSEQAKIAYLDEHVRYERDMLAHAFRALHQTPAGPDWNMAYESFGIHARNLYDFLRHEGKRQNTFRADQYVTEKARVKPTYCESFNDLDRFLCHMTADRAERQKLTLGRLHKLGDWIDREWRVWIDQLDKPFKGLLSVDAVCAERVFNVGVSEATACTEVLITSSGGRI